MQRAVGKHAYRQEAAVNLKRTGRWHIAKWFDGVYGRGWTTLCGAEVHERDRLDDLYELSDHWWEHHCCRRCQASFKPSASKIGKHSRVT